MSEAKHTPGPWSISQAGQLNDTNGKIVEFARVSILTYTSGFDAPSQAIANGRLIAAAQEMYELVKLVHGSFGGGRTITFSDDDIAQFKAAVAKAEGTSHEQ